MLRNYTDTDYINLKDLYQHSEWYGGTYSEHRDSRQRMAKLVARDPESIQVYEKDGEIIGSVSLFEDGRSAWLYRFVVCENDSDVTKALYERATEILKERGHDEILVYAPMGSEVFRRRYIDELGMAKGDDYTCYWVEI